MNSKLGLGMCPVTLLLTSNQNMGLFFKFKFLLTLNLNFKGGYTYFKILHFGYLKK